MAQQKQKELPEENKLARKWYRWLWFSPLLTIPTAIFIGFNAYFLMQSLLCPGGWRNCNDGLVEALTFGIAILGSALWHLVLLIPALDKQRALVRWHGRQALALAGFRTLVALGVPILSAVGYQDVGFISTILILLIIWGAGTLMGQEEAERGVCSLARWSGHEDELPAKPVKTLATEKESGSENVASEIDRLMAVIRYSDDKKLRKRLLDAHYEEAIITQAFFADQERPETSLSGSKITTLPSTIRHSPDKKKRAAALYVLDQLGLVETL